MMVSSQILNTVLSIVTILGTETGLTKHANDVPASELEKSLKVK